MNAYKSAHGFSSWIQLMDSAYGAVKQSLELTDAEQPIFKQLDIDKTLTHKLCKFMG